MKTHWHDEMCQIVDEVEKDGEQLTAGVENSLREVCLMDKQRREFMKHQSAFIYLVHCEWLHMNSRVS